MSTLHKPLERQVFTVTIDGRLKVAEMIEATLCDREPGFDSIHYTPKFEGRIVERWLRLVPLLHKGNFDQGVTDQQSLAMVTNNRGHTPTFEDGLAFSMEFPCIQWEIMIAVLDPTGPVLDGKLRALILGGDPDALERSLILGGFYGRWMGFWGLALCDE